MLTKNPFPTMLIKALAIALPVYVLTIGGAFAVACILPLIAQKFVLAAPERSEFTPMTLVIFDITPSIHPIGFLIGFGIVFLGTVGVLALPAKQQRFAGIIAGTLILAFWIAVGYQVRTAFTGPNVEHTNDTDALD